MKSIDEATPLIPEVIASLITPDPDEIAWLADRARTAWLHSDSFRRTLTSKRNDMREQLAVWFRHWLEARRKGTPGTRD